MNLAPIITEYLETFAKRGSRSNYRVAIRHFERFLWSERIAFADVDEATMARFEVARLRDGARPSGVASQTSMARAFLRWCAAQGYHAGDWSRPGDRRTDDPPPLPPAPAGVAEMRDVEAADEFFRTVTRPLSPHTERNYRSALRRWLGFLDEREVPWTEARRAYRARAS